MSVCKCKMVVYLGHRVNILSSELMFASLRWPIVINVPTLFFDGYIEHQAQGSYL